MDEQKETPFVSLSAHNRVNFRRFRLLKYALGIVP